eukprot:jgi/Bigna1/88075/estExt_fgenesh1_pg.C_270205
MVFSNEKDQNNENEDRYYVSTAASSLLNSGRQRYPDQDLKSAHPGGDPYSPLKPPSPMVPRATFCPAYHLGIAFFLMFAALMPTQNLLTSLNGTLGYYSIAVLYFFMACFGPVAPFVVRYFKGPKTALVAGGLTYTVFQIANVLLGIKSIPNVINYVILLPPSALVGMGACLLWTAEGLYATRVSRAVDAYRDSSQQQKHNQQQEPGTTSTQGIINEDDKDDECEKTQNSLGFVNGIVLVFLQTANCAMNLGSSALLSSGASPLLLFIVLAAASAGGFLTLLSLPRTTNTTSSRMAEEEQMQRSSTLCESVVELKDLHREKKLKCLLALFILCGCNQGYLWTTLTGDVITPALGKEWVGYVMSTSAAFDAVGSYIFGSMSDRIGRVPILYGGFLINMIPVLMVSIIGVPGNRDSNAYAFIFLWAILLGIADAVWMTVTPSIIAELFQDRESQRSLVMEVCICFVYNVEEFHHCYDVARWAIFTSAISNGLMYVLKMGFFLFSFCS